MQIVTGAAGKARRLREPEIGPERRLQRGQQKNIVAGPIHPVTGPFRIGPVRVIMRHHDLHPIDRSVNQRSRQFRFIFHEGQNAQRDANSVICILCAHVASAQEKVENKGASYVTATGVSHFPFAKA